MTVCVHIGNPKALSTSVQALLTGNEGPGLRYLGFRPDPDHRRWYDDSLVAELLNFDLRYSTAAYFDTVAARYREHLGAIVSDCEASGRTLWLSSENLSMKFLLADLDTREKLERLQRILPGPVTLVLIVRNVFDSLRSIWREYLKLGYTGDYSYFCAETLVYRHANFLPGLFPGHAAAEILRGLDQDSRLLVHCYSGPDRLVAFLDECSGGASLDGLPRLNVTADRGNDAAVLATNRAATPWIDALGLVESHRALWHVDGDYDAQRWGKLRFQHARLAAVESEEAGFGAVSEPQEMDEFIASARLADEELLDVPGDRLRVDCRDHYDDLWIKGNDRS